MAKNQAHEEIRGLEQKFECPLVDAFRPVGLKLMTSHVASGYGRTAFQTLPLRDPLTSGARRVYFRGLNEDAEMELPDELAAPFGLSYGDDTIGSFYSARECAYAFHKHRTLNRPVVNLEKYTITLGGSQISIKRLLILAK